MRAMESTRRNLKAFEERGSEEKRFWRSWRHQKHLFRSSSPEADIIRGSEDHQKLEDWRTSNVVQMMIESRLSLQKIGRIKQRLFQMDLKALVKENRIVFRIKQRIKIRFSFLGSLRINTWISDSIVTSKCGIWKLETGISIIAKQAASSRASSKSTRTVLLQNSVLAKESEVSES